MANLDRFKKLERARPDDSQPKRTESHARFQGGGRDPGAPSGERRSGGDQPLRLKEDDGGLSFVRCCHCRADNPAFATRCRICEADLATEEQRRFNEELYRALEEQREAERRASEAREAERRAREAERRQAEAEQDEADRRLARQQQQSQFADVDSAFITGRRRWGRSGGRLRKTSGSGVYVGKLLAGLVLKYARENPGRLKALLAVMAALDVLFLAVVLLTGHGLRALLLLLLLEFSAALRVWYVLRSE